MNWVASAMFSSAELGNALRLLRVRRNLSQGEVATRAKMTSGMLSSYEMGHKFPSFPSLTAILNALFEDFHSLQEALNDIRNRPPATDTPIQSECLGRALRLLRTQRGLTQGAVANQAGITKAMLSTYETGKCFPAMQSLTAVLDALKCDFHSLQEALLLVLGEGERWEEVGEVRGSPLPTRGAESAPGFTGSIQDEPEAGGQVPVAFFQSLGEGGPSIYVQLHPVLRSLNSGRAVVWIEVTGPG